MKDTFEKLNNLVILKKGVSSDYDHLINKNED